MNKTAKLFLALALCGAMSASTVACFGEKPDSTTSESSVSESIGTSESDSTTSESTSESDSTTSESTSESEAEKVEKLATVVTATANELAAFNATNIKLYGTETVVSLETAYTFTATETLDEAKANQYANWYADYYVTIDRAISENEFGLAGSYAAWDNGNWVAFYAPATQANVATPLLKTFDSRPEAQWTYVDIVRSVDTFKCGVFDNNNACSDMTVTVELRLTNPENESEYFVVNKTEYKFA